MSIPEKLKSSIFQHISPLAKRIVIYTVLASSFITLFTSTLQLFQVYKSHVTGIELRLNEIRYSYGENIASRVWITNVKELDLALQGILRLPDIEYIEVYEYDELLTKQGQVPDSDTITDNFPLYYTFRNKQEKIGRIFIVASLTRTYQEIIDQALVILFSNAFKTFLISGFMAFIFYHLVARHLITLSRFAGTLDASSLDNTLELVRKKHTGKGDEIDLLGNTLTDLQSRLKKPIEQVTSSQSQVKLLLDSTAEAIYGIDTQGSCTFANKACIDILGYQNDSELLGKNMHELIHYKYADGTEYPVTECKIFQSFQQKKGCHIDNEVLWCKDGSNFSAEYWSHPIFKNNICIGAVVTFIDISVRLESEQIIKENEKNLAVTLNSIGDAVITTDSTGTITRMNPVAEKLTGWSFADAQGLSLNKVFSIFDATTYKKLTNLLIM